MGLAEFAGKVAWSAWRGPSNRYRRSGRRIRCGQHVDLYDDGGGRRGEPLLYLGRAVVQKCLAPQSFVFSNICFQEE